MEESDLQLLLVNLQDALSKASQRHGNSRSAAGGRQGHQRTPAMIEALLKDAKSALHSRLISEHVPAGGFTDVGQHTGGNPRNTAWPLAREVFRVSTFSFCGPEGSLSTSRSKSAPALRFTGGACCFGVGRRCDLPR